MALFPATMESERLRFERIHPADVDLFEVYGVAGHHVDRIEETTRYMTWDPHQTPKESAEFVEHCGEQFDAGEAAQYLVRPKDGEDGSGELAGTTGLTVDWDRQLATLGIWLRPEFWGRGYSGERAGRLLELAFERLDLAYVAVTHATENEKSQRAVERYVDRFGGQREGTIRNGCVTQNGEPYDSVRYSISNQEWAEATDR
jgi:RimJ/RimL family protein N-acetyltransferase